MATDIQDLDKVDVNNQTNWADGMKVQDVNNAGQADEGMLARWFGDWNGETITTGTAPAYTVSSNTAPSAYYDGFTVVAEIHEVNAGSDTLNSDSLGAIPIVKNGGDAIKAGDLPAGYVATFIYRGTDFNLTAIKIGTAGTLDVGVGIGDVVQLEDVGGNAGLPAVDGSQLTGIEPSVENQNFQVLTAASGTWTSPGDITTATRFKFTLVAAGGGGGGVGPSGSNGAGGGAGGGTNIWYVTGVEPSTGYAYNVGQGGTAGSTGGTAGGTGGDTDITINAATATASGGGGGGGKNANTVVNGGTGGGTTGSANLSMTGSAGDQGTSASLGNHSGNGGSSTMGGGAVGLIGDGTGGTGGTYGGGASGAFGASQAGGVGGVGVILVEWVA